MIITTRRLILRPFTQADKVPYAEMGANRDVMKYYPALMNKESCDARVDEFEKRRAADGFHFLAAELTQSGEFVGLMGLAKLDEVTSLAIKGRPRVEIGWVTCPKFWGQGLAPEGARACLAHAWQELGLAQIVAFTSVLNKPSQRVMQKIGMHRDPSDDFEHPMVPEGHKLRPHVAYRIWNPTLTT